MCSAAGRAVEEHRVVPALPLDDVAAVTRVPDERIVAAAHERGVGAAVAVDRVVPTAADQRLVAGAACDPVVAAASVDRRRHVLELAVALVDADGVAAAAGVDVDARDAGSVDGELGEPSLPKSTWRRLGAPAWRRRAIRSSSRVPVIESTPFTIVGGFGVSARWRYGCARYDASIRAPRRRLRCGEGGAERGCGDRPGQYGRPEPACVRVSVDVHAVSFLVVVVSCPVVVLGVEVGSPKRLRARETSSAVRRGELLGLGGDHDLVGGEGGEGVGDREQRIGVADAALRVDAADLGGRHDGGRAALRLPPRPVLVRQPAPEPGVQRGRDDEDLGVAHVRGT